jgi:hypothetical protein
MTFRTDIEDLDRQDIARLNTLDRNGTGFLPLAIRLRIRILRTTDNGGPEVDGFDNECLTQFDFGNRDPLFVPNLRGNRALSCDSLHSCLISSFLNVRASS